MTSIFVEFGALDLPVSLSQPKLDLPSLVLPLSISCRRDGDVEPPLAFRISRTCLNPQVLMLGLCLVRLHPATAARWKATDHPITPRIPAVGDNQSIKKYVINIAS
jgi:hypothetical protein